MEGKSLAHELKNNSEIQKFLSDNKALIVQLEEENEREEYGKQQFIIGGRGQIGGGEGGGIHIEIPNSVFTNVLQSAINLPPPLPSYPKKNEKVKIESIGDNYAHLCYFNIHNNASVFSFCKINSNSSSKTGINKQFKQFVECMTELTNTILSREEIFDKVIFTRMISNDSTWDLCVNMAIKDFAKNMMEKKKIETYYLKCKDHQNRPSYLG